MTAEPGTNIVPVRAVAGRLFSILAYYPAGENYAREIPVIIQCAVKAPDGFTATFSIPADEPGSVTIARLDALRPQAALDA